MEMLRKHPIKRSQWDSFIWRFRKYFHKIINENKHKFEFHYRPIYRRTLPHNAKDTERSVISTLFFGFLVWLLANKSRHQKVFLFADIWMDFWNRPREISCVLRLFFEGGFWWGDEGLETLFYKRLENHPNFYKSKN